MPSIPCRNGNKTESPCLSSSASACSFWISANWATLSARMGAKGAGRGKRIGREERKLLGYTNPANCCSLLLLVIAAGSGQDCQAMSGRKTDDGSKAYLKSCFFLTKSASQCRRSTLHSLKAHRTKKEQQRIAINIIISQDYAQGATSVVKKASPAACFFSFFTPFFFSRSCFTVYKIISYLYI